MIRRPLHFVAALLLGAASLAASPLDSQMKEVEQIRGLRFRHDVAHQTVSRDQLPQVLRDQMQRTMPYSTDDYMLILQALQLVDGTRSDLMTSMLALYQDQVLAFYDPLTHTYYSIPELPGSTKALASVADPQTLQASVAIHELTHALQDQVFEAGAKHLALEHDSDAEMAYHSLLEGEASFVMIAWMVKQSGHTIDDLVANDALANALSTASASDVSMGGDGTPRYFIESMKFPYVAGTNLVIRAYRRGGWKEVDRVHANPPRTSRELLHLDEYFARLDGKRPMPPSFTDAPPLDTRGVLSVEHLGEFHWRYLLGAESSTGWINDRAAVVQNAACEPTVLVETQWESADRARTFRDAYVAFLGERGISSRAAVDGTTVHVAYGADAALMRRYVP